MKAMYAGAIAVAAAATVLGAAPAEAMRCRHKVITIGDRSAKLLHYCGKPYAVQSRPASAGFVGNIGGALFPTFSEDLLIEEWTYNFGPNRLMRVVWLENGVVARIEQAGYGFGSGD